MVSREVDVLLRPVEVVLGEDLESLRRTFTEEERVELWNSIRANYKKYVMDYAPDVPRELDSLIRGKFRLAQLLLAATFKVNSENRPDIIRMFTDEEYEILLDFEKYKIFDKLSVDDVVEFIRRREGRVYELVVEYYAKQYNILDKAWGGIIGDLAQAFNLRYKKRREKIEKAVMEYVRRHGLLITVSEIEEAVKKVLEAGEFRRKIEEEVRKRIEQELGLPVLEEKLKMLEEERRRLYSKLSKLEERLIAELEEKAVLMAELERLRIEKDKVSAAHEALEEKLRGVEAELTRAVEELQRKEEELRRLSEEYSRNKGAVEALQAEAETLRRTVEELQRRADEYRALLERVTMEKQAIESRLSEIESAIKGEAEGHLVSSEEAWGLEEAFHRRIAYKLSEGVRIFDPVRGKFRELRGWDKVYRYNLYEGGPELKGVPTGRCIAFIKERGLIGKSKDVVVEGVFIVHPEAYAKDGFDLRPVGLAEILDVLSKRIDEAEKGKYYHLLIIASPTGFTSKAVEYIASQDFHRTFIARNVTVYLVDYLAGKVYRSPADKAAELNEDLAKPEIAEERVMKVVNYVLSEDTIARAVAESPAKPFIYVDDIVKEVGEPASIVRQALARLEGEGKGRVKVTREGTMVFMYNLEAIER